ncbi:MAG TPA: lactate racemase domain-containing protein [Gemmatimonadales bacterium]|nr:lactate racemase domain-containing protein [Gemmatimonadales bacterium]
MLGRGAPAGTLGEAEVRRIAADFVERERLEGKRIVAVIPDQTRSGPIDLMFRTLYDLLAGRAKALDFLIALGTHPPMSEAAIDARLGLAPGERAAKYGKSRVVNHAWKDAAQLVTIGTIPRAKVEELSGGMMHDPVPVTINRMVLDCDVVLIVGPTFPHEVVGFSGGNKYLFPGIAGAEIIDMFHWLGALITSPAIIGRKHTPVRAVVDIAAQMLPVPRLAMSLVVRAGGLAGLFCGSPEEAWSAAADLSERIHIVVKDRPFRSVLSCAPPMYDEMWVGGKCAYKLEPVVADGGELIVYGPHIGRISATHGALIERIGYHVRDYFLRQMDRFTDVPGGILAHSTHVKGLGTWEHGVERPRTTVTLATGIPEALCRKINLGWRDPASIDPEAWRGREDEGVLVVPNAGETLYRLRDDPFRAPELLESGAARGA